GNFVSLQSKIVDGTYGQLISSPIMLPNIHYCLSVRIYVSEFSKGTFSVQLVGRARNYKSGDSILLEKLEEMPKVQWRYLRTDFVNSRNLFKVLLRAEKEDGEHFWLAVDDIALHSGTCKTDPDTLLQDNGEFER
ncbi:unnamed protein product, partial [Litomosoides sigmodontis]